MLAKLYPELATSNKDIGQVLPKRQKSTSPLPIRKSIMSMGLDYHRSGSMSSHRSHKTTLQIYT